jgi:3-polyprenyl-4-hydroxybenzoate decarboxylase
VNDANGMALPAIGIGWTGASGLVYGVRLAGMLLHAGRDVNLVFSEAVRQTAPVELGQLIIVPREAPLATHHLEHLAELSRRGVPAMPGFYHRPLSVGEMVDNVVQRVCDHLGWRWNWRRGGGREKATQAGSRAYDNG